jgi:hypothetical protein
VLSLHSWLAVLPLAWQRLRRRSLPRDLGPFPAQAPGCTLIPLRAATHAEVLLGAGAHPGPPRLQEALAWQLKNQKLAALGLALLAMNKDTRPAVVEAQAALVLSDCLRKSRGDGGRPAPRPCSVLRTGCCAVRAGRQCGRQHVAKRGPSVVPRVAATG